MANVTVRQPAAIRVRVEGQKTRVQTLSYGTKTLRSATDLDLAGGANTGDVIVYNSQTKTFGVKPLGDATPISGHLIPTKNRTYDLGDRTHKFRSLYLSGNTIDMDGTIIKADAETGSIAFAAKPTADYPNPIAMVVTPQGGFSPVQTVAGEIPVGQLQALVANAVTYMAFTGADAGFF